jgi:predicted RNase H-like HicB family nuclease
MMNKYEIIIFWSEDDQTFVAEVPELSGCMAHGDSYDNALGNVKVAMELWIKSAKEFNDTIPVPKRSALGDGLTFQWSERCVMRCPKIMSVSAIDDNTLLVEFDNDEKKKYDITPLLNLDMFSPLKDAALFNAVEAEKGGYAVVWNGEIDISEYELWSHGETIFSTH